MLSTNLFFLKLAIFMLLSIHCADAFIDASIIYFSALVILWSSSHSCKWSLKFGMKSYYFLYSKDQTLKPVFFASISVFFPLHMFLKQCSTSVPIFCFRSLFVVQAEVWGQELYAAVGFSLHDNVPAFSYQGDFNCSVFYMIISIHLAIYVD